MTHISISILFPSQYSSKLPISFLLLPITEEVMRKLLLHRCDFLLYESQWGKFFVPVFLYHPNSSCIGSLSICNALVNNHWRQILAHLRLCGLFKLDRYGVIIADLVEIGEG